MNVSFTSSTPFTENKYEGFKKIKVRRSKEYSVNVRHPETVTKTETETKSKLKTVADIETCERKRRRSRSKTSLQVRKGSPVRGHKEVVSREEQGRMLHDVMSFFWM